MTTLDNGTLEETTLKILNIEEKIGCGGDERTNEAKAVRFEVINVDNSSVERHPKIALNVIELRVALAMRFLDFVEINDRL
jgi:hypothetical protein